MTVKEVINLLHKSVNDKTYDLVPTMKNRRSRQKYGLTIYEIEDFLKSITEYDLESGPIIDRDKTNEELFVFMKEIAKNVLFYVKVKKDSTANYDRIKIISCHEAEYGRKNYEKNK